jgi:protoporphyrinogen oxidase
MARRALGRQEDDGAADSFASVMRANLGQTICEEFYFPYARKIWGAEPTELSPVQAQRRVAAGSFLKLMRKVMSAVPGLKPPGAGRFYYPRNGFGQISDAYAAAAQRAGAELLTGWRVMGLVQQPDGWSVQVERGTGTDRRDVETRSIRADHVWSTLPITQLARMVRPAPPDAVMDATRGMEYRAMLLVYLTLPVRQFTEFDAHYFPESHIRITRLSEPRNYSVRAEPADSTTLCAELPCAPDDDRWRMTDAALGALVGEDLARAGIPLPASPTGVHVRRLRFAYPIYKRGYEHAFATLDRWASQQRRLLSFGRQGLFAHDNTHHALRMAYAAADCLGGDDFDLGRWGQYRSEFESHVVED